MKKWENSNGKKNTWIYVKIQDEKKPWTKKFTIWKMSTSDERFDDYIE